MLPLLTLLVVIIAINTILHIRSVRASADMHMAGLSMRISRINRIMDRSGAEVTTPRFQFHDSERTLLTPLRSPGFEHACCF